jgi:tetratricopeptide (TPR) repeat protein
VLLLFSVMIATAVSLIGLRGANVYSTIGNTTYVSGYLIFNLFFCLILFLRDKRQLWRWLYLAPALVMLREFWACHTSGAIIGLFFSVLLLFFLLGLFHKSRALRRVSLTVFIIAVIGTVGIFSQYRAAWFQNSFLRNLTFQKATFQTRLISWQGAAKDFKNHVLFGTGFGNYAIIFDKHFDSEFFDYARTETYFDRAHNNLVDIVSTTGLVGLLAYLSIFIAVLYYLFKRFRQNGGRAGRSEEGARRNLEIIVVVSLLAAYFIQNLAVFDSLVTYIGLMMTLGFIYYLLNESAPGIGRDKEEDADESTASRLLLDSQWELLVLVILLALALLLANRYNLKPWRMFKGTIVAYNQVLRGDLPGGVALYKEVLSDAALDHDARATLVNFILANPGILNTVPREEANAHLEYTISLAKTNVAMNPQDSLKQMQLAQVLDTAARFNYQDLIKFNYYSRQALEAMDLSIESSPGRAPVYLVKAQMLLARGEKEAAIENVEYAISLNPNYAEGHCRLAQFYLFLEQEAEFGASLKRCVDLDGVSYINSGSLLSAAANYFTAAGDYERALKMAERLAFLSPDTAEIWFNLAKLYLITEEQTKADFAAAQAIRLKSELKTEWLELVKGAE